jgi:hypothetical protein
MMDRQARASIRVMRLWKPHDLGVFLPPSHYPASHHEQDRFRERRALALTQAVQIGRDAAPSSANVRYPAAANTCARPIGA